MNTPFLRVKAAKMFQRGAEEFKEANCQFRLGYMIYKGKVKPEEIWDNIEVPEGIVLYH